MDKIVCVGVRTWIKFLARPEELSTLAGEVRQKFDPQVLEGWLDSQDVCLLLNVTKRTLQTYWNKKLQPYISVGGKFLYRESDIAQYFESKTINSKQIRPGIFWTAKVKKSRRPFRRSVKQRRLYGKLAITTAPGYARTISLQLQQVIYIL